MDIEEIIKQFVELISKAQFKKAKHLIRRYSRNRGGEIGRRLLLLGWTYGNAEDYEMAVFCLKLILQVSREIRIRKEAKKLLAIAYNLQGVHLVRAGLYKEAEDRYRDAISFQPDFSFLHNNYAILLRKLNRYEEARQQYEAALNLKPEDHEVHHNYAVLLLMLNDIGSAEQHIKESLSKIRYFPAELTQAVILIQKSENEEAEKRLRKLLRTHPDDSRVLSNLGIALFNQGSFDESANFFSKARNHFIEEGNERYSIAADGYLHWIRAIETWSSDDLDTSSKLFNSASERFDRAGFTQQSLVTAVMSPLLPLDRDLVSALEANNLQTLNNSIERLYDQVSELEGVELPRLPDFRILSCKLKCTKILYYALHFENYHTEDLEGCRKVFREFGFGKGLQSVNSLDNFLQELSNFECLEEISPVKEQELLRMIQPFYVLNGKVTRMLSRKAQTDMKDSLTPFLEEERSVGSEHETIGEQLSSIKGTLETIQSDMAEMKRNGKKIVEMIEETKDLIIRKDIIQNEYIFEVSEPLILRTFLPISNKLRITVKLGTLTDTDIENFLESVKKLNAEGRKVIIGRLMGLKGIDQRFLKTLKRIRQ